MDPQRFDSMLMEILQERKTIAGFLDAMFGFLSRNTDFYYEQKDKSDKVGFPPGMKEKIVFKVMQKFDPKFRFATDNDEVPPAVQEVEVQSTQNEVGMSPTKDDNTPNSSSAPSKEAKAFFQPNEYHNGACFDSYCWSQTSTEVELHVRLPEEAKVAKDVSTKIDADHIKVTLRSCPEADPIFDAKMSAKCKHNDALWTISEGKLQITLDKMKEAWWERFNVDEPDIDVSKIDTSKYIDDLPPDSQAAIEKLRWEQQQKDAQKPVELEKKNLERLREAWDAEGSPFKGQPFDPSLVKFN